MKVLMINKFLFKNGGSESYVFRLGNYLKNKDTVFSILAWIIQTDVWVTG